MSMAVLGMVPMTIIRHLVETLMIYTFNLQSAVIILTR